MTTKPIWLATVLLLALPSVAHANTFTAKVIGVADGDTITVLRDKKRVKIRVHGVDCPEKAQPYWMKAKQFTSKMVFSKVVKVEVITNDCDGHTVARVVVSGERLNESLVKTGLAWVAPYDGSAEDQRLKSLQQQARSAKRGLWAQSGPVHPGAYKAFTGNKRDDAIFRPLRGNTRTKVFHDPSCPLYCCNKCTTPFKSPVEAKKAGYHAHLSCLPEHARPLPPKLPYSKDRVCKRDVDCIFLPGWCPFCPPCTPTWRRVLNRQAVKRFKARRAKSGPCPVTGCKPCARQSNWLGTRAVCVKKQCAVRP